MKKNLSHIDQQATESTDKRGGTGLATARKDTPSMLRPGVAALIGAGLGGLIIGSLTRLFDTRRSPAIVRAKTLSHRDVVSLNREDLAA